MKHWSPATSGIHADTFSEEPTAKKEAAHKAVTDRVENKGKDCSLRIEKIVATGGPSRELVQTVLEKDMEKVLNCTQNQEVTGNAGSHPAGPSPRSGLCYWPR